MLKQQIINDVKEADRIFTKAWGEGWDDVEIDIDLLNRLIRYSRLLALRINEPSVKKGK